MGAQNLGKIKVKKSDAAHYYRKRCLSTDPFDQFRNFYAACENVASKMYRKKPHEAELTEMEHALRQWFDDRLESLKKVAATGPSYNSEETIHEVARILHDANRCQLNHSKAYRPRKVPFNPVHEKEVTNALPLVKFVARSFLEYEESSL